MPISADTERRLLNHYKLTTLSPDTWPHRDDESSDDDDDDDDDAAQANGSGPMREGSKIASASLSAQAKYQRIDRRLSNSPAFRGSEDTVQKDEPDPLGARHSVAVELKRRGLPVEDDVKLRNRFMLSSTSFSPAMFLAKVHQDASTEDLLRGLDFLSNSIEQKSASLRVLVESNFEKFVKAKATIDNVYSEMRTHGIDDDASRPLSQPTGGRRPHSRQISKNQTHFRNTSNPQTHFRNTSNPMFSPTKPGSPTDKKKNALTKDSEYGVQGIKLPLSEVAVKAEEVWGPALGGREKEEVLRTVVSTIEQHKDIFRLNGNLAEAVRKNDYDNIVDLFRQAKKHAASAKGIADRAKASGVPLSEPNAQLIVVTAKMWHDSNAQISTFKSNVMRRLKTSHGRKSAAVADETDKEEHMELIAVLLQLGIDPEDNNPIWEWLHSRYLHLKDKIAQSFERSRIEIEILRRKLSTSMAKADPKMLARNLRCVAAARSPLARLNGHGGSNDIDEPSVIAFWDKVLACMEILLSSRHGVLGEIVEYWETTQSFINTTAQKAFPIAVFATGAEQLELEPDDVANLRSGADELVNLMRESINSFFSDPPVDDISELYSPILSPTPTTPDIASALTPSGPKRSFSFDPSSVPPPSAARGDAWEKFAFWPPQANTLSGCHYLARILTLVGAACAEMASMNIIKQNRGSDALKTLVATVRERCVQAVCAAWNTDAERCKILETWMRSADRRDLTTFPTSLSAFMERILTDVQKIAYISDAVSARGSAEVIVPPPTKLLQALRGTFVASLYKALSGMRENAEERTTESRGDYDPDGVTKPKGMAALGDGVAVAADSTNKNVRILLTLSNISHLRTEIIPHLITQFETNFSVKLTDETKSIHDALGNIDAQLFQSYVQPSVERIGQIISTGIASPEWAPPSISNGSTKPTNPKDAKPYVYNVLLALVLVHSEVASTAPNLTTPILSYLLEQASRSLMTAFKGHPRYSLPALMQATLDVEFLAQTLNNYTTDRASDVQSQIYLALDERTDNDARARLQGELPEMRAVLKRLREATKGEFGCFRRDRRGRSERAGTSAGRGA